MHHTGHEENHSYGTKTREWQMDTVILMQKIGDDQIDFNLKILKARTRTPENRRYFEKVSISLQGTNGRVQRRFQAVQRKYRIQPANIMRLCSMR